MNSGVQPGDIDNTTRTSCCKCWSGGVYSAKWPAYSSPLNLVRMTLTTYQAARYNVVQMAERSGDRDKVDPALIREVMRELGRRGGTKRATRLTKEQRRESARRAVLARWARAKSKKKS